jgi:hypothetical protein
MNTVRDTVAATIKHGGINDDARQSYINAIALDNKDRP